MRRWLTLLACLALGCRPAPAYPVGPALSLADLTAKADVVLKAQVVSGAPVDDPWFTPISGFVARATLLRPITVLKGGPLPATIAFRHYAPADKDQPMMYMPQWYKLADGGCYLIFAARAEQPDTLRQLVKNHTSQEDQGVIRCADATPCEGLAVDRVVLAELSGLLHAKEQAEALYAIDHLDAMSGGGWGRPTDFQPAEVMTLVGPLVDDARDEVATRALTLLGGRNPYLSPSDAPFWLASVPGNQLTGLAPRDLQAANEAARAWWHKLAAVADSRRSSAVRATAIRALGRAKVPELLPSVKRWTEDPADEVRAAAAVLAADYPELRPRLRQLAADKQPAVRLATAQAIGYGQLTALLPELAKLVDDADAGVSAAAAMTLMSFPLGVSRPLLTARLENPRFGCLFVNALAKEDAGRYLAQLEQIVRTGPQPEGW